MLYPMRVLRALGRSGDGLASLGANPWRVLRRWWLLSLHLVSSYPELVEPCLRHLLGTRAGSQRGRGLKRSGPGNPMRQPAPGAATDFLLRSRLLSRIAQVHMLAAEEATPKRLMHLETALNDLSLEAGSMAQQIEEALHEKP